MQCICHCLADFEANQFSNDLLTLFQGETKVVTNAPECCECVGTFEFCVLLFEVSPLVTILI